MALDPASLSQGLEKSPGFFLAALCICAMVAEFFLLLRIQSQRLRDRDTFQLKVESLQREHIAAVREVIPLTEKLLFAVAALSKPRGRTGSVPIALPPPPLKTEVK